MSRTGVVWEAEDRALTQYELEREHIAVAMVETMAMRGILKDMPIYNAQLQEASDHVLKLLRIGETLIDHKEHIVSPDERRAEAVEFFRSLKGKL